MDNVGMTLNEEMDGWTYDETLREWSYPFLRYTYDDGSKSTSCVVSGFDGVRIEDGHERGKDYKSFDVLEGRYNHAVACFNAAENPGAQRLWWLALDMMSLYLNDLADIDILGKAWTLKLVDVEGLIARYSGYSDAGTTHFPTHRLEEIMYLAICSAPWDVLDNDEPSAYLHGYEKMAVDMLKQLYPNAADAVEVFREQLYQEFPRFKFNEPAARAYVEGIVMGMPKEQFELPALD